MERLDEATSHSNEELKEGIRDIASKKSRLEIKLKEEQTLREKLENAVDVAQEEQAKCKDEVASLYRQLQREREECNLAVKDAEEKMAKTRAESVDEIQEGQRRLEKQKEEFEEKLADTKLQLADEKSTVKALRKQQEKDGKEIENMRTQINRLTEEKTRLRQNYDELQHDIERKDELREQDKTRITELETEIRRCHHSLNRVTDEKKDTFEKADADKVYYITELEKQNATLKDISRKNKDLEEKARENQERIAALQRKISKLTKSLDDATEALQNSMVALVDNQKLLDELYNFRGDQEERDRIHYKYARFQEQVKLLTRELNDAKTTAEEQKKDTQDASNLSARLLESLNQISTPHLAGKRNRNNSTSFLSRPKSKSREDFGSLDTIFSSSCEDVTHLKEDHNFKTPKRTSVRDVHYKRRSTRNSTHNAAEKD
ncbi:Hypothetical predicted protein [Paramuricea clavata]|uniref:Uncharacterized protein n=1 Tax=Paramuricea clavata TaxID=317549 RepID=A0A6S7JYG9_PARCT|nr:Hypothetical predicted protein [Paramuricea clavata]